jgi:hypothetical protein
MATLTLNRGNYVLIGEENDGVYQEIFGLIEDYHTEGGQSWLKIKILFDIGNMQRLENIKQYNSRDLGSIPKLETFASDEGSRILEGMYETAERRAHQNRGRTIREAVQEAAEPAPTQDTSETDEPRSVTEPTFIYTEELEETEQLKSFSLNLETGDMKTIMIIAEENPKKVFSIIDHAVSENGHIVLSYISEHLRSTFIELKIDQLKNTDKIILEKGTSYLIKDQDNQMEALYLGYNTWIVNVQKGFSYINDHFIRINPEVFTGMHILKLPEATSQLNESLSQLDNCINPDLETAILEDTSRIAIAIQRQEPVSCITSQMLGKAWTDTITYFYFTGGNLKWSELDLLSFEDVPSIKKLAIARKDTDLLELLKAV